jgi:hypothetical protein
MTKRVAVYGVSGDIKSSIINKLNALKQYQFINSTPPDYYRTFSTGEKTSLNSTDFQLLTLTLSDTFVKMPKNQSTITSLFPAIDFSRPLFILFAGKDEQKVKSIAQTYSAAIKSETTEVDYVHDIDNLDISSVDNHFNTFLSQSTHKLHQTL